ncbi:MAG: DNA-binding protein [Acidobacteriaceae bacterium]|nr:DNA-binding protein [Acidobacteriaceae bacterium]
MRHIGSLLICGLTLCGAASSQQTRQEVTRNENPAEDARPNSGKVPDAYAITSEFRRIVIVRVKYKADLLAGIESIVAQQKVKNAVFLSALGSVRNYRVHVVANRDFPSKDLFVQDPTAPADIIGMNGYVVNGRVHAHISLASGDKAFGGHLESGTNVFTFAVVTLGVLPDDVDLSKVDDKTYR